MPDCIESNMTLSESYKMVKGRPSRESCIKWTDLDSNGESFYRQSYRGAKRFNGRDPIRRVCIDAIQWDESRIRFG